MSYVAVCGLHYEPTISGENENINILEIVTVGNSPDFVIPYDMKYI